LKIVRYVNKGTESYGILENDEIIDLPKLSRFKKHPFPSSIEGLISHGLEAEDLLEELMDDLPETLREEAAVKKDEAILKPPITSPPKIVCLGLNYRDHAEEASAAVPEEPIIFMKPRTAIIGPEEPVIKPSFVKQLDYEVELAIIIGKKGKNIPVSDGKDYIVTSNSRIGSGREERASTPSLP